MLVPCRLACSAVFRDIMGEGTEERDAGKDTTARESADGGAGSQCAGGRQVSRRRRARPVPPRRAERRAVLGAARDHPGQAPRAWPGEPAARPACRGAREGHGEQEARAGWRRPARREAQGAGRADLRAGGRSVSGAQALRVQERQAPKTVALDARHLRRAGSRREAGRGNRDARRAARAPADLERQDGDREPAARAHRGRAVLGDGGRASRRATTRLGGAATCPSFWRSRARSPRRPITRPCRWPTRRAGGPIWRSGRAWPRARSSSSR